MTTYYMTVKEQTTLGYWEPCKATTLAGAKREATRELGGGFLDGVLMVATGDGESEQRLILSSKALTADRWVDFERIA